MRTLCLACLSLASLGLLSLTGAPQSGVTPASSAGRLALGVEQLRHAHGEWTAVTEFLNEDGSVAGTVDGTYRFEWVVPDRVLSGVSEMPALGRKSGILFYVDAEAERIEMSSVGADGKLWVMTGPIDGEVRETAPRANPDGTTLQLRFTRSAVEPDRFESTMELSTDAGRSWKPGNHQVFERVVDESDD